MKLSSFLKILGPILLIFLLYYCSLQKQTKTIITNEASSVYNLKIESYPSENHPIVKHFAYSLSYNEQHEQADWVQYFLSKKHVESNLFKRENKFRADQLVLSLSADQNEYKNSGYDKGHLAPAADFAWNEKAMTESFFMSNISPQDPKFNRGIWKKMEEYVRDYALKYGDIYVVTGPYLTSDLPKINNLSKISVPQYYFKIVLDISPPETRAFAFWINNGKSDKSIFYYYKSIDEIEKLTGLDFFSDLPDDLENMIESNLASEDYLAK
jgi:endonuclease G